MRKFSRLLLLLIFVQATSVTAQKSAIYTHDSKDFDKALSLFNDAQYPSAQIIFEKVKSAVANEELRSDCSYYVASCAIRTNQADAGDLMERFVSDYPTSIKQNKACLEVAHYYFNQEDFPHALQWFEKVDEINLRSSEQDKFNFQKGYSLYSSKNKKEAKKYLNKLVNSD